MKPILFAIFMVAGVAHLPALAQTKSPAHKVVMQISSNDTLAWKGLMNNLRHLKEGWANTVKIEVVAHGNGIDLLRKNKTTQQAAIAAFARMGILFVACENTLKERKVDKSEILPDAGFVKMGLGEIILKQEAGWSYIKAGF